MKLSLSYSLRSAIHRARPVMSAAAEGAAVRMNDHRWTTQTAGRCLITFEARPWGLADLRSRVRRQLGLWGASSATDAAELAVTELATNVIRHVGEGAPATLLMEAGTGRVRVELHDTSAVLPHVEEVCPDTERGRGLSLVAAVADDWFAVPTPGGKAVCCEFAASTADHRQRRFGHRIARASEVIESYDLSSTAPVTRASSHRPAADTVAVSLITDVLHWLAANGRDPDTVLDDVQTHFEAESYC